MKPLEKRIIDISYKYQLSHIGSCLTAVGIIDEIFRTKKEDEKFILSCGHAGLALYVVLEKYQGCNAEALFNKCGVHPDRMLSGLIDCSTGSLGQGLPIALGMAMAGKNVYCLISDGECAEGSIYEAMAIKSKYSINNLKVYVNYNGWSAYGKVKFATLNDNTYPICIDTTQHWFIQKYGQAAHYKILTAEDYKEYEDYIF